VHPVHRHSTGLRLASRDETVVHRFLPALVEVRPAFFSSQMLLDISARHGAGALEESIQQFVRRPAVERLDQWLNNADCSIPGLDVTP